MSSLQSTETEHVDPLEELAAEARNDLGAILKFVKGEWKIGDTTVPAGTEYIAYVDQLIRGWIRFDDKKVVQRILVRRGDKKQLPERDELSCADQDDWPRNNKGESRDPWVKQFFVPLLAVNDGSLVTFVTNTVGGKIAVGKVCDAYLNNNRRRPIVALSVGDFKTRDYGKVESPVFQIVSFEDESAEALPELTLAPAETPAAALLAKTTAASAATKGNGRDMDDEIPF